MYNIEAHRQGRGRKTGKEEHMNRSTILACKMGSAHAVYLMDMRLGNMAATLDLIRGIRRVSGRRGSISAYFGSLWAHFGVIWETFGSLLDCFGAVWDNFGISKVPHLIPLNLVFDAENKEILPPPAFRQRFG